MALALLAWCTIMRMCINYLSVHFYSHYISVYLLAKIHRLTAFVLLSTAPGACTENVTSCAQVNGDISDLG